MFEKVKSTFPRLTGGDVCPRKACTVASNYSRLRIQRNDRYASLESSL